VPHTAPHVDVARSHAWWAGQSAGPLHPQTPPTHADPAALAAQLVQLGPHASDCVSATHALATQHVVAPHVPSPASPHAAVHVPAAPHVGVPPAQAAHAAPELPHAPLAFPPAHWPAVGSQHPLLHAVSAAPPHAVPHVCVVVSHAWPLAQSVAALQPHASVAGMHTVPLALPVQSTQALAPPHAVWLVPGRHEPPVPQQPALQGAVGEHVKRHRPETVSQPALFEGQSLAAPQPHCPPLVTASHTSPLEPAAKPAAQDEHVPPLLPHAVVPVPAWQVPRAAEQQPPLQGCDVPHVVVHAPVVVLQASSAGQSAAFVHGPGPSGAASTLASFATASTPASTLASIVASTVASIPASCPAGASTPGLVSGKLVSGKLASAPGPFGVEEPKQPASATPMSVTTMVSTANAAVTTSARSAPPRVPIGLL
jgi:hypothetical protein